MRNDTEHRDHRAHAGCWVVFRSAAVAMPLVFALMIAMVSTEATGQRRQAPQFEMPPMLVITADEQQFRVQHDRVIEVRQGQMHIRISEHAISTDGSVAEGSIPSAEELQDIEVSDALLELVDRLGDASFSAREAASERLRELDVEAEQLYAVLEQRDLSLEQRLRVLDVLQEHLLHAPRGAIGIRMRPLAVNRDDSAVVVVGLIAGLPAEDVLREDDRITHVDGERIHSPDQLTSTIQARRPGDRVRLTVERPERDERGQIQREEDRTPIIETLEVDLTLGSAERLVDPNTGQRQPVQQVPPRRHQEVREAIARYAERIQEIQLNGELPEISDPEAGTNGMDVRVDDHTFIRQLREQRQWIDQGNMRQTRALREQWEIRRRVLERQIEQPNLTDDERDYLRKVLERYEELMER